MFDFQFVSKYFVQSEIKQKKSVVMYILAKILLNNSFWRGSGTFHRAGLTTHKPADDMERVKAAVLYSVNTWGTTRVWGLA